MSKRREANARLYDAALGRFLSPDPYVQAPNFTQNFNRYSYCLNNPLVYVDEDGEFIFSLFLGPLGTILDGMCWGAVIGAGSGALPYTIGAAISGNWTSQGFWSAVGMGAVGGALGGGFGALGSIGALGSFGNTIGYNLLNQAANNALTNTMFGNEMTWGSVIGMAAGGLLGSALPNFKATSGGAFKNAMAEIGFNSGRGAITGLASGLIQAGIDKNPDAIWQNTLGGVIGGASSSIMNIATFGSAVKFDRSDFIGVQGEQPVYRSGGISKLMNGTGISWGRTAWANKNEYGNDLDIAFAHEGFHYEQQKKLGFANFYGRTIKEYARYLFTTGSTIGAYINHGNLEYGAMQNQTMYEKLKTFLKW